MTDVSGVLDISYPYEGNLLMERIKSLSDNRANAQQYPKDITKLVVPRDGYVMFDADYSQIEYRTLVAMAKEPMLAEMFKDPDTDYHTLMASLMYGVPYAAVTPQMRSDAKSFNFGIPYGMGFKSLAILLTGMCGPTQIAEAKEKYELYFKDQPNVKRFFEQVKEMAEVNKYTKTFWNRYRYYSFVDKDGKFSNAKRAAALRQAGNACIQGTAADIFKISVARNFCYIRQNNLLGLVLIVNMVHDEQLFELNCEHLDIQSVFRDIVHNMEFHVDGFPPLYIGAGFGPNWKEAKGKMAEIHPALADQLSREAENNPIYTDNTRTVQEVLDYFDKRVYEFRKQKVADYLMDPKNFKQDIHPVIGSLINLQFTYGLEEEYSGEELLLKAIEEFIKRNNLPVDPENFRKTVEHVEDVEEDSEYDDTDDDDTEDIEEQQEGEFSLIEEDEAFFGVSIQDMIKEFGLVVSRSRKVCGIDITILPLKQKDNLADFLAEHEADENEDGAMQVVFLQESNVLFNTGVYVKGFNGEQLAKKLSLQTVLY